VVHLDFGLRLEDQPDHGRLLRPALRHQVSQVEVQPADLPKNCRTINSRKMNNLSSKFANQDFLWFEVIPQTCKIIANQSDFLQA
jgi:hypothetical protein